MAEFPSTDEFINAFGPPPGPEEGLVGTLSGGENPLSIYGKWHGPIGQGSPTAVKPQEQQGLHYHGGNPALNSSYDGNAHSSVEFAVNYSYWAQEVFLSDDVEVWACTDGGQLGAALETWRVFAFNDLYFMKGYLVYFGGGIDKNLTLRWYDPSASSRGFLDIGGIPFGGYPTNIGLRINGSQVEAWDSHDDGATWVKEIDVTHTGTRGGGWYIGIGTEEQGGTTELGIGCFGGGIPRRTQLFRWLPKLT